MYHRLALTWPVLLLAVCAAASVASAAPLPGFRSPSGNIRCILLPGYSRNLLCTIDRSAYATALQARCMAPGGAGVDWHGFTLSPTRKGLVNCSGGIQYSGKDRPVYVTLAYGSSWRRGAFTCMSQRTGVTCRARSGHGLFVSREAWRTW